jgi:hypothetical protein
VNVVGAKLRFSVTSFVIRSPRQIISSAIIAPSLCVCPDCNLELFNALDLTRPLVENTRTGLTLYSLYDGTDASYSF